MWENLYDLMWSGFGTRIIHTYTGRNAPKFLMENLKEKCSQTLYCPIQGTKRALKHCLFGKVGNVKIKASSILFYLYSTFHNPDYL